MGMFDDYYDDVECPVCGYTQTYWQGKDGPCQLAKYYLGDPMVDYDLKEIHNGVLRIYETCGRADAYGRTGGCDNWIDALAIVHEGRWVTTIVVGVSSSGHGSEGDLWHIGKKE